MTASLSHATFSGSGSPPPITPSHPHYTRGIEAFKHEDWQGVIEHMTQAIRRRPWHDNAYNLIGYAYRKLGNYAIAITHYQKALQLNPHHRGALEYLGETYLQMGCRGKAQELLDRLHIACKRVTQQPLALDHAEETCEEWQELNAALNSAQPQTTSDCKEN